MSRDYFASDAKLRAGKLHFSLNFLYNTKRCNAKL